MIRTLLVLLCCALAGSTAVGAVIVVTNRAARDVSFSLLGEAAAQSQPRHFKLAGGDVTPIVIDRPAQMTFLAAGQKKKFRVVPNGLYYFGQSDSGQLELGQIGLSTPPIAFHGDLPRQGTPAKSQEDAAPPSLIIPVKILYDDAEVSTPAAWERRVRARFDEANDVFKKHCFVEFRIVAVESWHSDKAMDTLEKLLGEFERLVDPAPARVAIGFTGRRRADPADRHMGGTRGPLHAHLMIREHVNRNSEAERLELVIHELGHYLGAVHSPETNSVMRPALGDRQARATKFRIGFDPLNTLAMCLVSQELRRQSRDSLAEMQPTTRVELLRIYTELARAIPDDPTAPRYVNRLGIMLRELPAVEGSR